MKDHLGRFFEVMADRRSEYIDIGFAFGGKKPKWEYIPHSRADGIGGFFEFLQQRGYRVEHAQPATKKKKPGFWKWPFLLLRSLADKGPYAFAAVALFKKLQPTFSGNHEPVAKGHLVFSKGETLKIAQAAKSEGVTVNSYLLSAIHNVVYPGMTNKAGPLVWYIPVDLRPWLLSNQVTANIFSMLFCPLEGAEKPAAVHTRLNQMLRDDIHWHFWLKTRLAGRLRIAERISKRPRKTEFHLHEGKKLGFIFSNLGSWRVIGGQRPCPPVLFSPPPLIVAPASIGAVTVNGRLSLTLQVHPALQFTPIEIRQVLRKIHRSLLYTKNKTN